MLNTHKINCVSTQVSTNIKLCLFNNNVPLPNINGRRLRLIVLMHCMMMPLSLMAAGQFDTPQRYLKYAADL